MSEELTLDDFYRLPDFTIVAKTWPYQGENAEPDLWRKSGGYWVEITDTSNSHRDRYAPDCAFSEGASHLIVWQPTNPASSDADREKTQP